MAGETVITVTGNLTGDPELRFTPSGSAVANFTIASTPRTFDRQANDWKDGDTLFLRASVWREAAENVAETLQKGMRVIAQGTLKMRQYETKEGEKRTSTELEVIEIGPSLKYASATVTRAQNNQNSAQKRTQDKQEQSWGGSVPGNAAPAEDPWGATPSVGGGGWGNGATNDPPF